MKKLSLLVVLATLLLSASAFAECDPVAASLEYQTAVQKLATEDPAKLAAAQADIVKFQNDLSALAQEGKSEELCKAFAEITAKLK